jgi:hypothetical protein
MSAELMLRRVRSVFAAFDWATDDRQIALEKIEAIVMRPRADGSIGATHVRPDGTAQLSHEDLLTVLGALADAVDFTTPVMRVRYRALLYRLGDDR